MKIIGWFKESLLQILAYTLVLSLIGNIAQWAINTTKQNEIDKLNVNIGVAAALSQQQKVKIVEAKVIEEKIHVVTRDRIQKVKEYPYDANKTDCQNGITVMRSVF
ncbi:hypothetical protein [Sulfuricurvum sp.]|uniref:hypothetical protein n=1 Tax=Sulfuricurvum sp. TaxID=2025608 RepID=UPI00260D9679|nr:hypothetical protein [Sulfuricurvum sp.]MDD2267459.1 hypothetical protein [Sulfuricurvum sp.]MDD2782819.1 hypothetical protein [Sulfuricurvum sp.]